MHIIREIELEKLIDEFGADHVLETIELILSDKADHILNNYNDETLADTYNKAANVVDTAATELSIILP